MDEDMVVVNKPASIPVSASEETPPPLFWVPESPFLAGEFFAFRPGKNPLYPSHTGTHFEQSPLICNSDRANGNKTRTKRIGNRPIAATCEIF